MKTNNKVDISKRTKGELKLANSGNSYAANKGYETGIMNDDACLGFIWGKTKEQSQANAAFIVLACNNHDKLVAFILEMANRYENSEWIGGEAKKLLQSIEQQP